MNEQQANPRSFLELPKPQPEDAPAPSEAVIATEWPRERQQSQSIERGVAPPAAAIDDASAAAPAAPAPPMSLPPPSAAPPAAAIDDASAAPPAADAEHIEQAWIDIAKRVVERTRDDPHAQNEALGKVKADYQKRRYNRSLEQAKD
jgi:hypothetical protein